VEEGKDAKFMCPSFFNTTWFYTKHQHENLRSPDLIELGSQSPYNGIVTSLVIRNASLKHQGYYYCISQNWPLPGTISRAILRVMSKKLLNLDDKLFITKIFYCNEPLPTLALSCISAYLGEKKCIIVFALVN